MLCYTRRSMPFLKVMTMYAVFQQSFQSFKVMQRGQRYVRLVHENNKKEGTPIELDAVLATWDKQEVIPLLHFWCVFGFISLYDSYLEVFVSWIPFYAVAKLILMILLLAPQTRGATVFFEKFLTPQLEKRMAILEAKVFPVVRGALVFMLMKMQRFVLDHLLHSITYAELSELDHSLDHLLRCVTREGYRRNRAESISALEQAVPEEKLRVALLDDILREFNMNSTNDSDWTVLHLQRDGPAGALRVHCVSEANDDEEDDDEEDDDDDDDFAYVGNGI